MEKRSNEELAVLAQKGDEDAFELLWKQTEASKVSGSKLLYQDQDPQEPGKYQRKMSS